MAGGLGPEHLPGQCLWKDYTAAPPAGCGRPGGAGSLRAGAWPERGLRLPAPLLLSLGGDPLPYSAILARHELLRLLGRLLSLQCGSIEGLGLAGSPFPKKKKPPTGWAGVGIPTGVPRADAGPVLQSRLPEPRCEYCRLCSTGCEREAAWGPFTGAALRFFILREGVLCSLLDPALPGLHRACPSRPLVLHLEQ